MEKKKRRHFPDEFKRQAVERVETSGLALFEVAAELGVHESQLCRWARQFGQAGALTTRHRPSREVPGPSPADLAAENARLKRELQRAQAERDILKKASPPAGAKLRRSGLSCRISPRCGCRPGQRSSSERPRDEIRVRR